MKYFISALLFSNLTWAVTQNLECTIPDGVSITMNRFTLNGSIDISEKGNARAQLNGTTQMAGYDTIVNTSPELSYTGTARVYPAKSLGFNEVTLIRLKTELNGRVMHLTAACGLNGPQSTLTIQGIPFRAECKLK